MAAALQLDDFALLDDGECEARIRAAKKQLGERAVLLGHHYQREEVYRHADLTGDSLKLAHLAAETEAEAPLFSPP